MSSPLLDEDLRQMIVLRWSAIVGQTAEDVASTLVHEAPHERATSRQRDLDPRRVRAILPLHGEIPASNDGRGGLGRADAGDGGEEGSGAGEGTQERACVHGGLEGEGLGNATRCAAV